MPFVDDLVEVFGLDLLAELVEVTRRMLYRYQDRERRPRQAIQLRLAHLTDVVSTLRTARYDHAIVRWFTEVRTDGVQPAVMLTGRWRRLDEGPHEVMAMAVRESCGPPEDRASHDWPQTDFVARARRHDRVGLDEIVERTGVDRIRLQRYRRGETWPSWDTQRQFGELLAVDRGANLGDLLSTR